MSNGVTASWLNTVVKAVRQGLHVVLYGNVKDVFMRAGRLLSFDDALDETLASCGYMIRCNHTIPDGITFPHPDMQHEFQQLLTFLLLSELVVLTLVLVQ